MIRFANNFHSWLRHSWKPLANRLTRDPKIVIHGNSCIILYIFTDAIASITHGFMQMVFLNWYACQKRAKTSKERANKPGRQFLQFLRVLNLSLWLVNTFLIKKAHAKDLHEEIYGMIPWVIISNIFPPLLILYYFHSMACVAEVIVRSYTDKYISIARPSKPDTLSDENALCSVVSFVGSHSTQVPWTSSVNDSFCYVSSDHLWAWG